MLWLVWVLILGWHRWPVLTANLLWVMPNYLLVWLTWKDYAGLSWLIHNRILQYVGTRSYSLYLIHWFVLGLVSEWSLANAHTLAGFFWRLGVTLGISLVASELSYRYIEKPGINWGKRVLDRLHWGRIREKADIREHALAYKRGQA